MNNYNYGHVDNFWDLIIQAVEDRSLTEERKVVTIVSPWIRNINLSSSNYSSSNWRSLLSSDRTVRMNSLSDVFGAMVKIGFRVDIIVVNSEEKKSIPVSERKWARMEKEFVNDLENCGIKVWKRSGEHAKMYAFPHGVYTGSTNCTNQGMLRSIENMTMFVPSDGKIFYETLNNARAIANGCEPYFAESNLDSAEILHIPMDEPSIPDEEKVLDDKIQSHPKDVNDKDKYLNSPGIALGHFSNDKNRGHYLDNYESSCLSTHIRSFEKELRRIVVDFYKSEGNRMKGWKQKKIDKGLEGQLRNLWTRLLEVNDEGQTLYQKAEYQIFEKKRPPYTAEDFPNSKLPDRENLTPDTLLTFGTTISDLRTCLFGNTTNEFHDFGNTYLIDESLKCYTSIITGNKGMSEESVKYFWRRLFGVDEAFQHIAFARNELDHSTPLARTRAIKCQEGLLVFEKRLMRKFADYLEG